MRELSGTPKMRSKFGELFWDSHLIFFFEILHKTS